MHPNRRLGLCRYEILDLQYWEVGSMVGKQFYYAYEKMFTRPYTYFSAILVQSHETKKHRAFHVLLLQWG